MHAFVARIRRLRGVPFDQHPILFRIAQQRQITQPAIRIRRNPLQQRPEVNGHPLNRRRFKQVGGIFQFTPQPTIRLVQVQRQIKLRRHMAPSQPAQLQTRQLQPLLRHVLQHQHRLEDRLPAQVAYRPQFPNQLLERQVLVRISLQRRLLHLHKQLAELRISR